MAPLSILIIGAGVAGPTLASFLLLSPNQADIPYITILDRSASPHRHGQNIDVRGAGATIIRKLGLDAAVRASTTNEEGVKFVDGSNRIWAQFQADKSGKTQTGTSDIEILRGRLAEILFKRSQALSAERKVDGQERLEYIFGDYVQELDQDGDKVNVRFAKSGEKRTFDLVVGADGLQSRTRKTLFGDTTGVRELGMYGAFFSMPKTQEDGMWRRWFMSPGSRSVMIRPHQEKDKATAFMFTINEKDSRLRDVAVNGRKSLDDQKSLMKEYFQDAGWECDRVVKELEASNDFYYDMVAQIKLDKWSKGRVVLLGDAGYCASPISGMGTTLALNGAYNLAGAIVRHPQDHDAAFTEYESKMRPLVNRAQKLAPGAPHILCPHKWWGIWAMRAFVAVIYWSGISNLVFMFVGPPANAVPVEDYGFTNQPEWGE